MFSLKSIFENKRQKSLDLKRKQEEELKRKEEEELKRKQNIEILKLKQEKELKLKQEEKKNEEDLKRKQNIRKIISEQEEELKRKKEELKFKQEEELRRKQNEELKQSRIETEELKRAIVAEKKENATFRYGNPVINHVFCNFKAGDYCSKYDFAPVYCDYQNSPYYCSVKERKIPDYRICVAQENTIEDIMFEKRLTLFGEFYYDRKRFNKENYEDILDYLSYLKEHNE